MAVVALLAAWGRAEVRRQAGSFHSSHVVIPRLGVWAQSLPWEEISGFSGSRVALTGPHDAEESFGRLRRMEAGLLQMPSLALVPIIRSTECFLGLFSPQAAVDDLLAEEREV